MVLSIVAVVGWTLAIILADASYYWRKQWQEMAKAARFNGDGWDRALTRELYYQSALGLDKTPSGARA